MAGRRRSRDRCRRVHRGGSLPAVDEPHQRLCGRGCCLPGRSAATQIGRLRRAGGAGSDAQSQAGDWRAAGDSFSGTKALPESHRYGRRVGGCQSRNVGRERPLGLVVEGSDRPSVHGALQPIARHGRTALVATRKPACGRAGCHAVRRLRSQARCKPADACARTAAATEIRQRAGRYR